MIELTHDDAIAVVSLTYGKANALDVEFCDAISRQFDALRNSAAEAVVLTGQGRMFSAGVDLNRLSEGGAPYVRRFLPALHRLYQTVFYFPKPVVAAVNGHAIAGGCILQCCADKRIASRGDSRIGVTELLVGVPFPALAFEILRFATSPRYFADGVLSGATFTPNVALERGLIDHVVEPELLLDGAISAARALAKLPKSAFAHSKLQIRQEVTDAMERHGGRIDRVAEEIWTSPETLERVQAYVAKTLKKS